MNTGMDWLRTVVAIIFASLPGLSASTIKVECNHSQPPNHGKRLDIVVMKVAPFSSFGCDREGVGSEADFKVS
jgi:hypothetical protein